MNALRRYVPMLLVLALVIAGGAGCSKAARKNRYLESANRDFKAEQYDKAEIEYLKVLQMSPLNPTAIRQLGFIYHNQGRVPQAFAYLRKSAELEPENAEVRLKLGLTYMSARDSAKAREAALWVLEKQPGTEEALLLLADTVMTRKEIPEFQQRIEKLRENDKDRIGYHLALGWLYARQQVSEKAEAEFKKALAMDPKSSAANLALANIHWTRQDLKQAEQFFKTAAELAPPRSATHLKYADFKLKTGSVEEAKKIVEEINSKTPDYLPAWNYLMQVAFAERKFDECATLVKKVLARDSSNFDAILLSGRLRLAKSEGDKALAEFERMKAVYGRVPQLHYQIALAQLLKNDVAKAMGSLDQAVTLDRNFTEAILLLAELNVRKGNPVPAITSLTQLVKQQPQIPQAHLLLATAHLVQKKPDEAVAVYQRMLPLFPKNPQVPLYMGIVLAQQNKLTDARKAFEKSLELAPDSLPALEQLVGLDLQDKQYSAAMERVTKQMEKNPKAAEPLLLLAKVHMAQRDMSQAETALQKAIELNPDLRAAYLMLAQVYVASNKHQPALERLTALVAKTNDAAALLQIGAIREHLKEYVPARDAYEKLLTINPRHSVALNNLAYLYSERLEQTDKAYTMAEKARQLLPYEPHTADTLGWILYKKGEYMRALGLLQESAAKLPAEPEIQFHLGMTHYMLGEEEPARIALQQAGQATKDFAGKEEGQRRLALLSIDVTKADATTLADLEKRLRDEPNDLVALSRLAAIYERDGAVEKAVKIYERALKQNPKNARITINLAQLYSAMDPRKSLELAKEAHNLSPEDASISHTLGRMVYQTGDYKWASSLLQESARKLPNDPDVLCDLAWSYYSVGRVSEAEVAMQGALQTGTPLARTDEAKRFIALVAAGKSASQAQAAATQAEKILQADSSYVPALMVSALLQEQQGNYKEAQQLYDKVLARYPLFAPATRQLASLYASHLGDDQKAYALALKAREVFPDDPDLAGTLGILTYRRGDYARSAQLLKESARKRSNDAELLYYLGMSHYRLKEKNESKDALQRALALNVSTKLADEAKRVIGELK